MKSLNNILLILSCLLLAACNGGGSGSSASGGSNPPPVAPGGISKVNIDYSKIQQYAVPYNFPSSKNFGYKCIKVTNFISAPDSINHSIIGEFDLVNNCENPQSLSGLELGYMSLNRSTNLHPQYFSVNYISGADFAIDETDLGVNSTSVSRSSYLMTNLITNAKLKPYSYAHFTYTYSSSNVVSDYKNLILSVTGQTPINNSTLNVTLDTKDVSNLCNALNVCRMTLHVYGQNGNFFESHQITNGPNEKIMYQFNHINPGQYVISLSDLPDNIQATFSNAENSLQIDSGETENTTIKLVPIKLKTSNIKVMIDNPDPSVFPIITAVTRYKDKFSNVNIIDPNYEGIINNVPLGSGFLEISSIADSSSGLYYKYPVTQFEILDNQIADIGKISPTKAHFELIDEEFKIIGLNEGDNVELVFTDSLGYRFNRETQTASNSEAHYKFPKGDRVAVSIIISNKHIYKKIAPVSFTVTDSQILVFNVPKQ